MINRDYLETSLKHRYMIETLPIQHFWQILNGKSDKNNSGFLPGILTQLKEGSINLGANKFSMMEARSNMIPTLKEMK